MANMLCIQDKVLLDVLDSHEHVRASVLERDASCTDDEELAQFAAAALTASQEAAHARSMVVANARTGEWSSIIARARARRHHPISDSGDAHSSNVDLLEVKQHVTLQRYYDTALLPKEARRAQQQQRQLDRLSKLLEDEVAQGRTQEAALALRSRRVEKERRALSCACRAAAASAVSQRPSTSVSTLRSSWHTPLWRDHPTAIMKEARRLQAQDMLASDAHALRSHEGDTRSPQRVGMQPQTNQTSPPQRPVTDALARKVSSRVAMFMHSR